MTRRNFIALISLCVLVALGAIVVGVGVFATQSEYGQNTLRRSIQARVAGSINGKVHIGKITGNYLTGLVIDSLELRDAEDSLVVATGKITLRYDPRDLMNRRLYFRAVELEHPQVVLRQHEDWKWNYKLLFGMGGPSTPKGPERGFGDFVLLDSVHIRKGGSLRVTIPWHPDDSLKGARRDSAIRANLARTNHEIRRTREGLTQTYRWTNAYAFLPHIRVKDPDSVGMRFVVDTMHMDESTPPFKWRNIAGVVRVLGDSAWFDMRHWDLPRSTGTGSGKVWWGSDLPVRYDARIVGDSVSMSDIAWVYPTLPTTGGGKMILTVKNERDLRRLDYAITDLDVRTTKSHITGQVTFETGGPVLAIHDVKLRANPVNWDLLRTLNGGEFPADWQGNLTGTITARGGPVTNFIVDRSDITFHDAHVPGAVSRVQGRGELDILFPAFTAFHGFSVTSQAIHLRTLAAIYPGFPRMTGVVSGSAVLDSSWLDVRVSNADLTHTDGPGEPTRATGAGRITYGDEFMTYDLSLQAAPLSLTTLSLSYPKLPLRGTFGGPIKVRGIAPDLDVEADLGGAAGRITYVGRVDSDSLGGYGAKGAGTFESLDGAALLGRATPPSRTSGNFDVDIRGDSLANLFGALAVRLTPSDVDGLRIANGEARVRFDRGALHVDSLRVAGAPGIASARGSIGLTRPAGGDGLALSVNVDSLGGLRRYLSIAADSLAGRLAFSGTLHGWLDSLAVNGTLNGSALHARGHQARSVSGTLALTDVRGQLSGAVNLRADTAIAGGVHLDSLVFAADVLGAGHARFAGGGRADNGALLRTAGDFRSVKDSMSVRLDTLTLDLGESLWSLRRPSHFTRSAGGVTLDTLLFTDAEGARITGFIQAPTAAAASIRLRADSVPLADVGMLAQLPSALTGRLSVALTVAGSRERPTMTLTANARNLKYAGLATEVVTIAGDYDAERASVEANVLRGGRSILDATIDYPVALTLFSARATDDSLRGRVHADSVDLALVEALSTKLRNSTGRLALDLTLSGRPGKPHIGGIATVRDGGLEVPDIGLRLDDIEGSVRVSAANDSLSVEQLRWRSPASGGSGSLQGSVVFRDLKKPRLDLRLDARGLRAVDKRGLARLDVSTGASGITLAGTPDEAKLSGNVIVDRGTIYIPELARKRVDDLTPEDFAQLFDTTDVRNRSLMPQPPAALIEHLQLEDVSIRLGDEVWLRSREANIKLAGTLNVTRTLDTRETTRSSLSRRSQSDSARYRLALAGSLSADRGTYTLDLTAVQREFQVQSGIITFYGTTDFNPQIDVSAIYQVKQASRADIGVRARIHGNFYPQPALELSSTDAYLSPSDLVSYLVTGRPKFEVTAATQQAFEFVVPTAGAYVSRVLRDQLGGVIDQVQIQSGTVSSPLANAGSSYDQFKSILSSTRLGGEKQISDKLFLSFSTGLCQLGTSDASLQGLNGFMNAIEGKLEYRFPLLAPDRFSLRAGREPESSALRCASNQVRGFVATPQQWGFSLFRSWAF